MNYFVIGSDGKRYGPTDIATLNQWIIDGRVTPTTMLEDSTSGMQLVARAVTGLNFPTAPPPPSATVPGGPPPPGAPYAANPYSAGQGPSPFSAGYGGNYTQKPGVSSSELTQVIICTVLSPILSFFCIFGLATAIYGIRVGWNMKQEGSNLGILFIVINVFWLILWFVARFVFGYPSRLLMGH